MSGEALISQWQVSLRPINLGDAALIHRLRSSSKARQSLSAGVETVEKQRAWLSNYLLRAAAGFESYLAILHAGLEVGVVRIYNIDRDASTFTWGSWAIAPNTPAAVAWLSVVLLYDQAFAHYGLNKAYFESRISNNNVIRFHRSFGAKILRESDGIIYFHLENTDYVSSRDRFVTRLATMFKANPCSQIISNL